MLLFDYKVNKTPAKQPKREVNKMMSTKIENIIETLNTAYGTTTPADNKFEKAINSIKWEKTFEADGEKYFVLGDLTLTVEDLNPFNENWKPTVMYGTFFRELGW